MVGATRRTIAAIASLLMVLFWVPGLLAPSASAAPAPTPVASHLVGGFEIDGNFTPNDLTGNPGVDWNNVTAVETPDKVGNVDDTDFSGGSKECTSAGNCSVDNWVGATGVAPNKADISNVYVATRLLPKVANPSKTDVWGYFGLTRLDNNGSVFYDIELNQKVNKPNKNGISAPDRSDGDVLIILDQNGNGDFSFSGSIQKWVAVGNSDACQSGLVKPCWGVQTSLSSLGIADFFGKSNTGTIPGYKGVGSYDSDEFGEVGINLSAAGAIAGCPSTGFNVVNVRSKASPGTPNATDGDVTGSAEIKDYVAADVGIPSSCGELVIHKYGPGSSTTPVAGATFTVDPNPIPGQSGVLTVTDGDPAGVDTTADGVIDIDPAKPGTYTVTETVPPPGYFLPASPVQSNVVVTEFGSGGNAAVVSFHDPLGSLTIHKTGNGSALAGSTFTLAGPNSYSKTILDADTGTDSDGNGNGTLTWSGLKTGTYTLHEDSAPAGYDTVADRTFTIQSSDDDATHGRDLSATINDPKKTTTLSVWKYHTEADKTKTNLQGAVFKLYQSDSNVALANFDPSTATLVGSCTTAANGICAVATDSPAGDPGTHVITWDHYYYWVEQSVPFPYTVPDVNTFGPVHITAANIDDTRQPTPADDPKAQLTTTATASVTLPLAAGSGINDTAHLSGVNSNAGGAIVFNAYGPDPVTCTGTPAFTSTVTGVHGPGDYDSAVFTPTTAGAYKWSATYYPAYPGNTNDFVAAACTDPTELSTVNPAQPTMTTTATDTHTTSGKIHDTAQLAGYAQPLTGVQATFKLFTTNTCTAGTEIFTSTVAVDSKGFAQSGDYTVTNTTGTYYWQATLTGNTNNGTTNIGNDCGSTTGGNSEVSHAPVIAGSKASSPVTGSAASPTPVGLGSTIAYTVTVTNTGGTSATGVAVSDTIPTGTTYVANSVDNNGSVTNGVVSWTVDVPASGQVDLHFSVTVDSTDTNGQKIDNVAVVNGSNTNPTHHVVNFPVISAVKSSSPAYTTGNPPTPVSPGQTIVYTVAVTNSGLADATGVSVRDTVPTNSTYVSNSADNNGSLVGNAVTWSVDVPTGHTVNLHFSVTVDANDPNGTLIDNTATYANVNSPGCAAAATCNTNTTHHVVQFAIISAVKTANPAYDPAKGPTPVKPGQTITYTIAVNNSGLGDATGVPVSDTIPTGSTYVAGSADHNGTFAAGKVSWTIDVAHGTTVNLTFQVTVDAGDPNGTTIDNTAIVDNTPTNTTHHVVQFPIIGALKTSDPQSGTSAQPASVKPGQTISYTIAVSNSGQADDPAVAVSDAIPAGSTYVANSADNGGTFASGKVSWTVAVAAGKTVNLHFQVTVDANDPNGTRIENTAVVNGANTNTTYHVVQFPIIGAVKSSNPAYTAGNPATPVQPGQTIDYTIAVSNTGQADAANVTVNDPIPAGSTYVAGSADNGGSLSNGAVTWVLPTVGAGKTVNVHFQVTVDAADANGTTIDNVAVVNGSPTNTTHHVVQFAVLAMGKTASPASGSIVQRGDTVTYTITVVNSGLAAANGVSVSDTLPDHVTLVSGSAQPAVTSTSGKTLTWLVDIAPGTTKTVTYAVTVDSDAPEGATLTNVALIGGSCVGHADPAACTTDHHVPTGALTLVKHVDKTSAEYGDTLTYTFDAATTGALNQTGVTVTDVVPDKSTYVDSSAACDTGACTTAYDATTRTVTWTLGDMAAGAVRHVTFQVTIDKPDFDSTVGLPAETITNLGNIQSLETATTPSNPVETKVVEVLGVKVVRKPPVTKPRLPFTGMPTQEAVTLALLMIAGGIILASVRRRDA